MSAFARVFDRVLAAVAHGNDPYWQLCALEREWDRVSRLLPPIQIGMCDARWVYGPHLPLGARGLL